MYIIVSDGLSPHPVIENTIFADNIASNGTEIYISGYSGPSYLTIDYSNVKGGNSAPYVVWDSNCILYWGGNMISLDPIYATGPLGGYYLSQVPPQSSGQSPCVNTGDPSSDMITGTTRTDHVQDDGVVDMGYHYPIQ